MPKSLVYLFLSALLALVGCTSIQLPPAERITQLFENSAQVEADARLIINNRLLAESIQTDTNRKYEEFRSQHTSLIKTIQLTVKVGNVPEVYARKINEKLVSLQDKADSFHGWVTHILDEILRYPKETSMSRQKAALQKAALVGGLLTLDDFATGLVTLWREWHRQGEGLRKELHQFFEDQLMQPYNALNQ